MYKQFENNWCDKWFKDLIKLSPYPDVFFSTYCSNCNLSWKTISENLDYEWNWKCLSKNPNITCDIIRKNINMNWNWRVLTQNPNLNWEFIYENLDKNWSWEWLSIHPCITWDVIQSHPEFKWELSWFSQNKNLTIDIIRKNPEKFSLLWFSHNPNFSIEIIRENPAYIHKSEIVRNHPDKYWNWYSLMQNEMVKAKEDYIRDCYRKHFMQNGLFEELMAAVWHPRNMWKFKYLDSETYGDLEL